MLFPISYCPTHSNSEASCSSIPLISNVVSIVSPFLIVSMRNLIINSSNSCNQWTPTNSSDALFISKEYRTIVNIKIPSTDSKIETSEHRCRLNNSMMSGGEKTFQTTCTCSESTKLPAATSEPKKLWPLWNGPASAGQQKRTQKPNYAIHIWRKNHSFGGLLDGVQWVNGREETAQEDSRNWGEDDYELQVRFHSIANKVKYVKDVHPSDKVLRKDCFCQMLYNWLRSNRCHELPGLPVSQKCTSLQAMPLKAI